QDTAYGNLYEMAFTAVDKVEEEIKKSVTARGDVAMAKMPKKANESRGRVKAVLYYLQGLPFVIADLVPSTARFLLKMIGDTIRAPFYIFKIMHHKQKDAAWRPGHAMAKIPVDDRNASLETLMKTDVPYGFIELCEKYPELLDSDPVEALVKKIQALERVRDHQLPRKFSLRRIRERKEWDKKHIEPLRALLAYMKSPGPKHVADRIERLTAYLRWHPILKMVIRDDQDEHQLRLYIKSPKSGYRDEISEQKRIKKYADIKQYPVYDKKIDKMHALLAIMQDAAKAGFDLRPAFIVREERARNVDPLVKDISDKLGLDTEATEFMREGFEVLAKSDERKDTRRLIEFEEDPEKIITYINENIALQEQSLSRVKGPERKYYTKSKHKARIAAINKRLSKLKHLLKQLEKGVAALKRGDVAMAKMPDGDATTLRMSFETLEDYQQIADAIIRSLSETLFSYLASIVRSVDKGDMTPEEAQERISDYIIIVTGLPVMLGIMKDNGVNIEGGAAEIVCYEILGAMYKKLNTTLVPEIEPVLKDLKDGNRLWEMALDRLGVLVVWAAKRAGKQYCSDIFYHALDATRPMSDEAKAKLTEEIAAELHEEWKKDYAKKNGPDAARWKPAKDPEWEGRARAELEKYGVKEKGNIRISEEGTVEVDIAHTDYENLPEAWKAENKAAAEDGVNALNNILIAMKLKVNDLQAALSEAEALLESDVSLENDEWCQTTRTNRARRAVMLAGDSIHNRWLERNGSWAPEEQKKRFIFLDAHNQKLDLNILAKAIEKLKTLRVAERGDVATAEIPEEIIVEIVPYDGQSIYEFAKEMVQQRKQVSATVVGIFNGVRLTAAKRATATDIENQYKAAMQKVIEKWKASPAHPEAATVTHSEGKITVDAHLPKASKETSWDGWIAPDGVLGTILKGTKKATTQGLFEEEGGVGFINIVLNPETSGDAYVTADGKILADGRTTKLQSAINGMLETSNFGKSIRVVLHADHASARKAIAEQRQKLAEAGVAEEKIKNRIVTFSHVEDEKLAGDCFTVYLNGDMEQDQLATPTPVAACGLAGIRVLNHLYLNEKNEEGLVEAFTIIKSTRLVAEALVGISGTLDREAVDALVEAIMANGGLLNFSGKLFIKIRAINWGEVALFHEKEQEVLKAL
ncbi:hypothetical protein ACFL3J_02460, partial [Candidatus Omnitrophota bacterium]